MPEIVTKTIREEIEYHGTSVIIPRRECMNTLQRHLEQKKAAEAKKAAEREVSEEEEQVLWGVADA